MPSKRALREEVERLGLVVLKQTKTCEEHVTEAYRDRDEAQNGRNKVLKECAELRRQLSSIREKHGALHEVLYPSLVRPILTGISPSVGAGLVSCNKP